MKIKGPVLAGSLILAAVAGLITWAMPAAVLGVAGAAVIGIAIGWLSTGQWRFWE